MSIPTTVDPIAHTYNVLPYASRPFPQSHPARSAATARLFGLTPPDVKTARVLELGAASGGNLIPLAMQFPDATFVGIDLSEVQVAAGAARIETLKLENISLWRQSILDLSPDDGKFDYIICHGVYSWVPLAVRDAILRVSKENLADNGIAYISYNVFPGWRLRGALRDAMLFHVEGLLHPADKVRAARAFLAQLANATDANGPYGQMMRREAQLLTTYEDHYIAHEFLELNNDPCYVADFIRQARASGLEFLSEANLNGTIAETYGADSGKLLRDLSGNQMDRIEQYADFLTGRTFRQSLLVRQEQSPHLDRMLTPERLDRLHIALPNIHSIETIDDLHTIKDAHGRTLTTKHKGVRDCLSALAARYPQTVTIASLVAEIGGGGLATTELLPLVRDALFKMALIGMADLSVAAIEVSLAADDKPNALSMARLDAKAGQTWTTNARHEAVPLSLVQRAVLPDLDGTRGHAALIATVERCVADGQIQFQKDGELIETPEGVAIAIREHVASALAGLAKSGLLHAA
jgi:methyltransferase-like protein